MTPNPFIDLCRALRELGATHVRHGDMEATFVPARPQTLEKARIVPEDDSERFPRRK